MCPRGSKIGDPPLPPPTPLFFFFAHLMYIVFALFLSLSSSLGLTQIRGQLSGLFSPLPHYGTRLRFYRGKTSSPFPPSSTRIDFLRLPTLLYKALSAVGCVIVCAERGISVFTVGWDSWARPPWCTSRRGGVGGKLLTFLLGYLHPRFGYKPLAFSIGYVSR